MKKANNGKLAMPAIDIPESRREEFINYVLLEFRRLDSPLLAFPIGDGAYLFAAVERFGDRTLVMQWSRGSKPGALLAVSIFIGHESPEADIAILTRAADLAVTRASIEKLRSSARPMHGNSFWDVAAPVRSKVGSLSHVIAQLVFAGLTTRPDDLPLN